MIARVTKAKSGLIKYLFSGKSDEWENIKREERDMVEPLYGNAKLFQDTEDYLMRRKDYANNYMHITLSFSKDDMKKLNGLDEREKRKIKQEIVIAYIKHHTSGYDLKREVIAYAESHSPIMKKNAKGDDRYEHIHIGIMLYNPLDGTRLQNLFAKTTYNNELLQAYINEKYNLTHPKSQKRDNTERYTRSKIGIKRKELVNDLKAIKSNDELLKYFEENNIAYKEVKTKNNHYYKILNENMNDINLRGKGFEHLQVLTSDKNFKFSENMSEKELRQKLDKIEKRQKDNIYNRRSRKSKQQYDNIQKENEEIKNTFMRDYKNKRENTHNIAYVSFQQRVFLTQYKAMIDDKLKGYFIDTKDKDNIRFINKAKGVNITDTGNLIKATKDSNTKETVKMMLEIAIAKGWNLSRVKIEGSDEFVREYKKQRDDILAKQKTAPKTRFKYSDIPVSHRPSSSPDFDHKESVEKKEVEKIPASELSELKKNLSAEAVVNFAVKKYKLNRDDFEITADNKINNKGNRAKPKNVIDFLQKEINLTTKEAIEECKTLYATQPMPSKAKTAEMPKQEEKTKPKQRKSNERIYLHQPTYRGTKRRRTNQTRNKDDMRTMSDIHILSDTARNRSLLSSDERNSLREKARTDTKMQSADNRAVEDGREEEKGRGEQIGKTNQKEGIEKTQITPQMVKEAIGKTFDLPMTKMETFYKRMKRNLGVKSVRISRRDNTIIINNENIIDLNEIGMTSKGIRHKVTGGRGRNNPER